MSDTTIGVTGDSAAGATLAIRDLLDRIEAALHVLEEWADKSLPINAGDDESANLRKGYEALHKMMLQAIAAGRAVADGKQEQIDNVIRTLQAADAEAREFFR